MSKIIDDLLWNKKMVKDHGIDMQHTLHLIKCHDLVGEMIAQAQARGEFDNLEGAGQPLKLEENPYAPPELHMAYKILKDAGFAPYWIELGKEIDTLRNKFVLEVDYFKRYTRSLFCQNLSPRAVRHYERRKEHFYAQSRERLTEVSKKILDYNLLCPVRQLGKANFDVEEEMKRLVQEIEELVPAAT